MCRLFHHGGDMQQRLGGDAADIEADATQGRIAFDDHRLHAEVGGAEGGRVAAGPGAEHQHFAFEVGGASVAGWCGKGEGGRGKGRGSGRRGCVFPLRPSPFALLHARRFKSRYQGSFRQLVARLDEQFPDDAGDGRGNIHGRLVGFQRDQRVLCLHHIADLDQDFDDRHVLEVADVGDLDFDDVTHWLSFQLDFVHNDGRTRGRIELDTGSDAGFGDPRR
jgi:hypothetical protein